MTDGELRERIEGALRDHPDLDAAADRGVWVHDASVVVEAARESEMEEVRAAVEPIPGVESVHVEGPRSPAASRVTAREVDPVIAVASAKGGVGKTTVAAGIACDMAADRRVALFDSDLYGPNLPSVLSVAGPVRSDAEGDPIPLSVGSLELMSVRFMTSGGPLAWRGSVAHDALTDLFESTKWTDPGAMVVDLPPGTGDVVLTVLQEASIDGVVFVTTPYRTSIEDTRRSLELFEDHGVPAVGVVVNMARFDCPSCGDSHDLFPGGDPGTAFEVPVLGRLPFAPDLQERIRPGDVPEPLRSLGEDIAGRTARETR